MAGGKPVRTVELVGPAGRVVVNESDRQKYLAKGYRLVPTFESARLLALEWEEVEDEDAAGTVFQAVGHGAQGDILYSVKEDPSDDEDGSSTWLAFCGTEAIGDEEGYPTDVAAKDVALLHFQRTAVPTRS